MVKVEFLGPIEKEMMEVDVTNLEQLKEILQKQDQIKPWLQNSSIAINDTLISDITQPLKDGDKVSILPPVCGG